MNAAEPDAENLLCDTSFVSRIMRAEHDPGTNAHWPLEVVQRIDRAVLTISVFTVAEIRYGMNARSWGARRRAEAENLLLAYTWIPLDLAVVDKWAEIQADCRNQGQGDVKHNDVWIAATALVRGYPLVTCDAAQCELPQVAGNFVYLPIDTTSRMPGRAS